MPKNADLPPRAGAGFKPAHFEDILSANLENAWFEIHAENYMGAGGPFHRILERLREDFALSVHGVGLSIGAAGPLDKDHLERLKYLCHRYQPEAFSEHLAWSSHSSGFLNDLLPLPYTEETLDTVCSHILQVQDVLGRPMLLENPSSYLSFAESTIPETEFLSEITKRTGCGLLLDVNNVYVSATNLNFDPDDYLSAFPFDEVAEIHLAGHATEEIEGEDILLIDAHDRPVSDPVWALYETVIRRTGPLPTLIEWDTDIPDWSVLRQDMDRANTVLEKAHSYRETANVA